MDGPRITGGTINASLTDGIRTFALPRDWIPEVTVNQPYQLDRLIHDLMTSFTELLKARSGLDDAHKFAWLNSRSTPISQLEDSLYATRYHQRQFLFRLGRVCSEQTFAAAPPKGNVGIIINDIPLKVEFEAFLLRVTATLDPLARSICTINELHSLDFREFSKKLRNKMISPKVHDNFECIIRHEDEWIKKLKKFRNAVAHEGECSAFRGVSHRGLLVRDAEIVGMAAGAFVIRTWQQLLSLVADVVHAQGKM